MGMHGANGATRWGANTLFKGVLPHALRNISQTQAFQFVHLGSIIEYSRAALTRPAG